MSLFKKNMVKQVEEVGVKEDYTGQHPMLHFKPEVTTVKSDHLNKYMEVHPFESSEALENAFTADNTADFDTDFFTSYKAAYEKIFTTWPEGIVEDNLFNKGKLLPHGIEFKFGSGTNPTIYRGVLNLWNTDKPRGLKTKVDLEKFCQKKRKIKSGRFFSKRAKERAFIYSKKLRGRAAMIQKGVVSKKGEAFS